MRLHRIQVARLCVNRHVLDEVADDARKLSDVQQRVPRVARIVRRHRAVVGYVHPVVDGVDRDRPRAAGIPYFRPLHDRRVGKAEYAVCRVGIAGSVLVLLRVRGGDECRLQERHAGKRGDDNRYGGKRQGGSGDACGSTRTCAPPPPRHGGAEYGRYMKCSPPPPEHNLTAQWAMPCRGGRRKGLHYCGLLAAPAASASRQRRRRAYCTSRPNAGEAQQKASKVQCPCAYARPAQKLHGGRRCAARPAAVTG